MEQLYPPPQPTAVDPLDLYLAARREPPPDRPWVVLNMIATVDGAIAIDGTSGALGGPADKQVFAAVRALPDVILVGAGTVAAERYGPPRPSKEVQQQRLAAGQSARPRVLIVTNSLRLDLTLPLFTDDGDGAMPHGATRPLVITAREADAACHEDVSAVAEIVHAGDTQVDLATALGLLRGLGARVVLCEGGPSLNGELVDRDLIDELCLTSSPLLAGGDSPRIVAHSQVAKRRALTLQHVLEADGLLFLRYELTR